MSTVSSTSNANSYYAIPTATSSLPKQISTGALYLQAESAASSDTDTVSLSSAAQLYLEQKAGGSQSTSGTGFTLSAAQQQTISQIVAQYQDAPLTQDTFNQLQDSLKQAGLSPDELSGQDRAQAFNPELEYLNASNGLASALPSPVQEQAKSTAYASYLYNQLKAVATPVAA